MIELLIIADSPTVMTGFGRVADNIAKFLDAEKFNVSFLGVNYYGDPHEFKYKIFPASSRGDIYGFNRVAEVLGKVKPDVIFVLNDAWVQTHYLTEIKEFYGEKPRPRIITYTPVDAKDHSPEWYEAFEIVDIPVAYTQFGAEEIKKVAPFLAKRMQIIQHGVDSDTFFKVSKTRIRAREVLFNGKAFNDAFIVLSAGRNQPRKRLDTLMAGFALFAKDKDKSVKLYMHCGITDMNHINIATMAKRLGITDRLIITSKSTGVQQVSEVQLNLIYNACDVGLNTSVGEGFCLPAVEHAVTGALQIVPDHSALSELWGDGSGILLKVELPYVLDNIMTTGYLTTPQEVADKLEWVYTHREEADQIALKGMTKFTSDYYNWKTISKIWEELFTI